MAEMRALDLCIACFCARALLTAAQPGFLSLACAANDSFTDANGIQWQPDTAFLSAGAELSAPHRLLNDTIPLQLQTLRSFSGEQKLCYELPVNSSQRYLVRATFLYGNYDGSLTTPVFPLYLNVTHWADVRLVSLHKAIYEEVIFLSTGTVVDVCILKGSTGTPFISTLELRRLIGSMYSVSYELEAHLKHAVRINFGASTGDAVRYPDDEVDRIWESDRVKPNNLAREAVGTIRINTSTRVGISAAPERPPQRVLQSAVVGSNGSLTYRYLVPEFPAQVFGRSYFAEIQDLRPTDVRSFTFVLAKDTQFRSQPVNLARDIGAFQAYAPGYENLTLNTIINFGFEKTSDANLGPILNAMEILAILPKQALTNPEDVGALLEIMRQFQQLNGVGDPCLPTGWEWISCNFTSAPRITGLFLAGRNLSGAIPAALSKMRALTDIQLNNNSLTGPIPNLSALSSLRKLHLEDNMLSGRFPDSLAGLGNLQELNVENNLLTGAIPASLLTRPGVNIQYSGNPGLCSSGCSRHSAAGPSIVAVVGGVLGGVILCVAVIAITYFIQMRRQRSYKFPKPSSASPGLAENSFVHMISAPGASMSSEVGRVLFSEQQPYRFSYEELSQASNHFSNMVGTGGFGNVYYGKLSNGQEIAIKVKSSESQQGDKEFINEVTLLCKIHHKNIVTFIGYCNDDKRKLLVYEFMHQGTLRDLLYASSVKEPLNWITRLKLALDAAKGLDYLHTGCSPAIIHRDVKSSNILVSRSYVGKVSDLGLSTLRHEASLMSTTVRGSLGYLDPEYCLSQQLTEKSDVYSFGVVLLELISAREPIKPDLFAPDANIVQWARNALHKAAIEDIVDPAMGNRFVADSVWKAAELAMFCVEPHAGNRPSMSEVIRELQEACQLEDGGPQHTAEPSYHLNFAPRYMKPSP